MRYYEIATADSVQELDEDLKSKLRKLINLGAAAGTAATLGYGAGVATHPSNDIQQTPASIAKQMDYANNTAYDEPAGPSTAPTTSPRPKARPADLTGTSTVDVQTPSLDTVRPQPRPDNLTATDNGADLSTIRPKSRTQAALVTGLANADADVKVNNISTNKNIENMLIKTATQAGIVGVELQALLAQAYHESHNFTSTVEQLYGKSKTYFKRAYENPRAARILGNTTPGDGEKYKGRGYIQVTGRYNYGEAAKALGLPLLDHPELLEDPKIAAAVSVWYWKWRVQARMSDDWDNVQKVTDIVNGGQTAVEDRAELFNAYSHLKSLERNTRPD